MVVPDDVKKRGSSISSGKLSVGLRSEGSKIPAGAWEGSGSPSVTVLSGSGHGFSNRWHPHRYHSARRGHVAFGAAGRSGSRFRSTFLAIATARSPVRRRMGSGANCMGHQRPTRS